MLSWRAKLFCGVSAVAFAAVTTAAQVMLAAETQGIAIDFTDSSLLASTGFNGSVSIKDTGTPANNYDGTPGGRLTYTGTVKLTRQSDGVYRHQAHNLFLNSSTPATQTVTVVAGASYKVSITGSGQIALSDATSATVTAGSPATFTAGTANLVCTVSGGPSTAHIRRTPCDDTYIAAGASSNFGLPFEWDTSGVLQGILVEQSATNLFLNSSVGVTQTIAVTNAAAYTVSFFGTGSITFSGANSSTLNGTGATDRVKTTFTATSTSLVCTVSGSVTNVQVETGSVATSPIITYGSSATRVNDDITLATTAFPFSSAAGTVFAIAEHAYVTNAADARAVSLSTGGSQRHIEIFSKTGGDILVYAGAGTFNTNTIGNTTQSFYRAAFAIASNDAMGCVNGALGLADSSITTGQTASTLYVGRYGGLSNWAQGRIKKLMYVPRRMSNAELQALTA